MQEVLIILVWSGIFVGDNFFSRFAPRGGSKWGCKSKIPKHSLKFQNTVSDPFMIVVDFFVFGVIEYSSWFQFLCPREVLKLIVWASFWNYIACWKFHLKMSNLEFHSLLSLAISSEVNQSQAKRKNKVKFLFSQFFVVPQKVFWKPSRPS